MPAIILLADTDSEKLNPSSLASSRAPVAVPLSLPKAIEPELGPQTGAVSDLERGAVEDSSAMPAEARPAPLAPPAVRTPRSE